MQEDKALFSRLGRIHPADFSVTFSDLQTLQRLRKKLVKTRSILESTIEIMCGYKKHCLRLRDVNGTTFVQIDVTMTRLQTHKRSLLALLEQCDEVSKLVRNNISIG